jgi:regulator of sirC expression with transglutaminase-like and TPR domain
MDMAERFASLVALDAADVPLDLAALCIASAVRADVDVDAALTRLDDLAARCADATFDGVRVHLFEREGFRGNTDDYADPGNSFLDRVLERRLGIPITLSLVMIEVGRRVGVPIVGVGMPAHFLVRARDADVYCDPFNGGARLDVAGCAALFDRLAAGAQRFDPAFLAPVGARQILSRMLNNLEHGPLSDDPHALAALLSLHVVIPDLAPADRIALASRLANIGRFDVAARVVEAGAANGGDPDVWQRQARAFRARLN